MEESVRQEEIAAATAYEQLHVPSLFQQWAPLVAEAAEIRSSQRVVDVACGTGILAREAAARVGPEGRVVGVDPGRGFLAVARELAPAIDWRLGTAEALPCEDHSFDAVVSQFGMMFFPDRARALSEMTRVLAPGGRIVVAVWDALDNSEAYPSEVALLDRIGGKPAGDALRAPFVMGDPDELRSLFEGAGVTSVEIQTHHGRGCFPSVRAMVEADLRGWLPVMGVELTEPQIERILEEAETVLGDFVTRDGTVVFDSPAHIASGIKP